jgi:hypothetical protein
MKKAILVASAAALLSGAALTHAIAQAGPGPGGGPGAGPGPRGPEGRYEQMREAHRARFSETDRAAMIEARLAGIKAGLKLTPEQEKLWPALETTVRDNMKKMTELRDTRPAAGAPRDPVEHMRRQADAMSARADAMRNLANAAQPLYATLNDDQKRRLPMLMRMGEGGYGFEGGHHRHHR